MKTKKKKQKTQKQYEAQFKRIGKLFLKRLHADHISFDRLAYLINLGNRLEKRLNELTGKVTPDKFQNRAAHYLKAMVWYHDQKPIRKDMIMGHRTFCCPISGTILDMNDSFIVKIKGKGEIISSSGLNKLYHENNTIIKFVMT